MKCNRNLDWHKIKYTMLTRNKEEIGQDAAESNDGARNEEWPSPGIVDEYSSNYAPENIA